MSQFIENSFLPLSQWKVKIIFWLNVQLKSTFIHFLVLPLEFKVVFKFKLEFHIKNDIKILGKIDCH